MITNERNVRLIFGLKLRQLREGKQLSFKELSAKSGLSGSYLNEIEKGKKYPKPEKMIQLAQALDVSYSELVSPELEKKWQPVLEFLESDILRDMPLELFGLEESRLLEIISKAPVKVNAFISTLIKIARSYELSRENFYFAALRSYQELHDNYFEDLETAATRFIEEFSIDITPPIHRTQLYDVLRDSYGYTIDKEHLTDHDEFQHLRAVFLPQKRHLLINDTLTNTQKTFLLGKELAYNYLDLPERPYTSAPFHASSFELVLNNFKASYFSVALSMNRHLMQQDLDRIFAQKRWNPDTLLEAMRRFAASPEMFLSRATHLLTRYYKIDQLFFLRFEHRKATGRFEITKELHLSRQHRPHRNDLQEHYCRRWVSLRVLQRLHADDKAVSDEGYLIDAQLSHYHQTTQTYFCLSIARPNAPTPRADVSVTLGILVDDNLRRRLRFLDDPQLPTVEVNETCERCPIGGCAERAAPPVVVEAAAKKRAVYDLVDRLDEMEP